MTKIQVNPDELRQMSQKIGSTADNLRSLAGQSDSLYQELGTVWQGSASDSFLQEGQQFNADTMNMIALLEEFQQHLQAYSAEMEAAETNIIAKATRSAVRSGTRIRH